MITEDRPRPRNLPLTTSPHLFKFWVQQVDPVIELIGPEGLLPSQWISHLLDYLVSPLEMYVTKGIACSWPLPASTLLSGHSVSVALL